MFYPSSFAQEHLTMACKPKAAKAAKPKKAPAKKAAKK